MQLALELRELQCMTDDHESPVHIGPWIFRFEWEPGESWTRLTAEGFGRTGVVVVNPQ